jgi:hypothetical protein
MPGHPGQGNENLPRCSRRDRETVAEVSVTATLALSRTCADVGLQCVAEGVGKNVPIGLVRFLLRGAVILGLVGVQWPV